MTARPIRLFTLRYPSLEEFHRCLIELLLGPFSRADDLDDVELLATWTVCAEPDWAVTGPFFFAFFVLSAGGGAGRREPMRLPCRCPVSPPSCCRRSSAGRAGSSVVAGQREFFRVLRVVTASVTVFTVTGLLSFCSTICPTARTWTSWRNVWKPAPAGAAGRRRWSPPRPPANPAR